MPLLDAEQYAIKRTRKRRRRRVMTCLAAIVVFVTTYALILPAITMSRECQIPEHTHNDDCYTILEPILVGEPVCDIQIHQHDRSCYDAYGELTCGYADFVVHEHDANCYDDDGHLWCTLPEVEYHIHDESCYAPYEPQPVHEHTEECYEYIQGDLICDIEECEPHYHDELCYDEFGELICGLEQTEGHTHTYDCYEYVQGDLMCVIPTEPVEEEVERELICDKVETIIHVHDASCYELIAHSEGGLRFDDPYDYDDFDPDDPFPSDRYRLTCGYIQLEEHQHVATCYEYRYEAPQGAELICENTDPDHVHDYYCYNCRILTCGMEEHTHTEECMPSQEQEYYCGKEAHTHDVDTCYDADGNLICGLQAHIHDDTCLTPLPEESQEPEPEPTPSETLEPEPEPSESPEPEPEPEPSETPEPEEPEEPEDPIDPEEPEEPDDPEEPPIEDPEEPEEPEPDETEDPEEPPVEEPATYCGLEEHTHNFECYDQDGILICTLEEHTHTDQCYLTQKEKLEAILEQFTAEVEALEALDSLTEEDKAAADDLLARLAEAHEQGQLTDEAYADLCDRINALLILDQLTQEVKALEELETFDEEAQETAKALLAKLDEAHDGGQLSDENYRALYSRVNVLLFTAEVEALEALETLTDQDKETANDLRTRLEEAHRLGQLTDEAFTDLYDRVGALLVDETEVLAEPAYGSNWILLRDSGWFEEYSNYGISLMSAENGGDSVVFTAATALSNAPSSVQVDDEGGTNSKDDVSVSKTIDGTDIENVFDITLTVETPHKIDEVISEPDMAVVIVMDISNTMNDNFGGVTRYAAAVEAAEDFLDKFAESNTLGVSKVGYVAFNTDAHEIFGLQSCTDETQAGELKGIIRTKTGNIINNYEKNEAGNVVDHDRFTNVEGGLKMAQDMLKGVSNKNKFIIFLSDGFPTTYLESGYNGYDPYNPAGDHFYDHVLNRPCRYGTSYSDTAAIKAREMATSIKTSGTTIFSIGVDVGGQTVQQYVDESSTDHAAKNDFSVVDRISTTYEIGSATSADAYKNWLKNSIGSGYYYDSTNTAGLKDAYNRIFEQIKTTVESATAADWVASDPIPSYTPDEIEFIGLYDKDGKLQGDSLTGSHAENAENTAEYKLLEVDDANKAIQWDLKQSGYTKSTRDGKEWYSYKLKYRVRLKNEDGAFVESKTYNTNGTTTLQYRVVQTVNDITSMSESKTIDFPIPSVHGYLGELTFAKKDSRGRPLAGAEFTLRHPDSCNDCDGDNIPETKVDIANIVATSDANGTVTFSNIPSGHTYVLEETKVPDGYVANGNKYTVIVAYDEVTVAVKDGEGDLEWDGIIVNNVYYALPNTGGAGTTLYTAVGLLLMAAAIGGLLYKLRRKEEHETS